jgi:hypothetical protein
MKNLICLLFAFLLISGTSFSQTTIKTNGVTVNYDTTGQFAAVTLVGSKGYLKKVGQVDMRNGLEYADSIRLFVSFSDSIQVAFYAMPRSVYKIPAIGDTLGRATATGMHLWQIQNGAGHVTIPWFRLRAGLTDAVVGGDVIDIYIWISKVAGLHTYGTASAGKAAGKMVIKALPYY